MTLPLLPEEDHHCESCGLRYGDLTTAAALGLIRSYPTRYRRRLQHLPVDVLRRRPTSWVWSALEYACHVRDVYDVYDTRIRRTLTEHEPTLEPMRNDERAEHRAYNQQSLAAVLLDLERNVDRFAALTSEISEPQWRRSAVRLPRERRTVLWMVRQAAHEGLHHLHDIGAGATDNAVLLDVEYAPPTPTTNLPAHTTAPTPSATPTPSSPTGWTGRTHKPKEPNECRR